MEGINVFVSKNDLEVIEHALRCYKATNYLCGDVKGKQAISVIERIERYINCAISLCGDDPMDK